MQEGCPLAVQHEAEWLETLGLTREAEGIRKHFTAGQLAEALKVPRARLDRWLAAGLVQPVEETAGIPLFDFRQVAAARTLADLVGAGISLAKVRRGLGQLQHWLPGVSQPLAELCLNQDARRLVVRTPDGRVAETTGQLLFDFDPPAGNPLVEFCRTETEAEAFRRAVAYEADQRPTEAAAIYRQLIAAHGPHPVLLFNLGNVLYAADDPRGAVQQFLAATQLDPTHMGSWVNLANVLAELDQLEEAIVAYRRGLALAPNCADAHFNLAQTLVELGRAGEAILHWRAYLAFDADSTWADYARECLEAPSANA